MRNVIVIANPSITKVLSPIYNGAFCFIGEGTNVLFESERPLAGFAALEPVWVSPLTGKKRQWQLARDLRLEA